MSEKIWYLNWQERSETDRDHRYFVEASNVPWPTKPDDDNGCIPVVDKSAYDQLLQRNGELLAEIAKRKEIGEATAKVLQECADREAELEKENERLKGEVKATHEIGRRALDITLEEKATLELRAESLSELLRKFLNKTEVYLRVYPDDKELKKYREEAKAALEGEK